MQYIIASSWLIRSEHGESLNIEWGTKELAKKLTKGLTKELAKGLAYFLMH